MIGMTWLLYVVAAYVIWYLISRLSFLGAFIFAGGRVWGPRHWLLFIIGLCPLVLEIISTCLIIFTAALDLKSLED